MKRPRGLLALIAVTHAALSALAALSAPAAETTGTTLRFKLQPDQVLVYRTVSDIELEGRGAGERDTAHLDSEIHLEMVFSLTAGRRRPNGLTDVTIEILDVALTVEREWERVRRRIEMNAQGIKIYDGKKLVQEGAWGDLQLPGGLDLRTLLDTPILAAMSDRAELKNLANPDRVKRLLQGANFVHLLRCQAVLPENPISKGSTWQVEQPLVMANPIRLRQVYRAPGTETYTAVGALTHVKRRCLKVAIKGDWPKKDLGDGQAEGRSSATAIVDFETGVTFALAVTSTHKIEGTIGNGEGDFESKSTSKTEYVGGRKTYERYKAKNQ